MKPSFLLMVLVISAAMTGVTVAQTGDTRLTEENNTLRTATVKLAVNQDSRVAGQVPGLGFKYFADGGDTCYMLDGSLIIGTSADDLSMAIFSDTTSPNGHGDPQIGRLYSLSEMTFDTLPAEQTWGYRHAYGVGCNRDSSIAFDVEFLAPRHPDSSNFIIGVFSLYSGPKDPSATVNGVTVCYAADWNIPDDSNQNIGGYWTDHQYYFAPWQRGVHGQDSTRYGTIAYLSAAGEHPVAFMHLDNARWVAPLHGYFHDSIWAKIQTTTGYSAYNGPPTDLHTLMVIGRNLQIKPKAVSVYSFALAFAGLPEGSTGLTTELWKAWMFKCRYLPHCVEWDCNACGNANGDAAINISDAVYIIAYIFAGGPAPEWCTYEYGLGDANGDMVVNISDAVYLIWYIFGGGPAPHCCCG